MTRLPMSPAAAALFRALLARCGGDRDRILLTDSRSTDWQSLTFVGERHRFCLRFTGADAEAVADSFCSGLADHEFAIPGQIVADIQVAGTPWRAADGAVEVSIEALTIAE
jgi:hypothetical protein